MADRQVSKDTLVLCPECKKEDYAIVWDEATRGECYTRELRRAYVSIIGNKGVKLGTKYNYKCPNCSRFIRGSRLKFRESEE